jgi:hypothetical protein
MKPSEKIRQLGEERQKQIFRMPELCEIFQTTKGGVREIMRGSNLGQAHTSKQGDRWIYPEVLVAALKWEKKQEEDDK